jgi:hypothetical protein
LLGPFRAIVITLLFVGCSASGPGSDGIHIHGVGLTDKPLPDIWITKSPRNSKEFGLSHSVVVKAQVYSEIVQQTRLASCGSTNFGYEGTLEVSINNSHAHTTCIIYRQTACGYFEKLVAIAQSDAAEDLRKTIANYQVALRCS